MEDLNPRMETIALIPSMDARVPRFSRRRHLEGWKLRALLAAVCVVLGQTAPGLFPWLLLLAFLLWSIRSVHLSRRYPIHAARPAKAARLACVGHEDDLSVLRDLADDFFEPFIVQTSRLAQPGGFLRKRSRWRLGVIPVAVAALVVLRRSGYSFGSTMGIFVLFYLVTEFIYSLACPVYYRIAPGCLDVLTASLLSGDVSLKRRMSLRDCSILCLLDIGGVSVRANEEEAEWIRLVELPDEREFVRKLFAAAISPHRTPPLSTTELIA